MSNINAVDFGSDSEDREDFNTVPAAGSDQDGESDEEVSLKPRARPASRPVSPPADDEGQDEDEELADPDKAGDDEDLEDNDEGEDEEEEEDDDDVTVRTIALLTWSQPWLTATGPTAETGPQRPAQPVYRHRS